MYSSLVFLVACSDDDVADTGPDMVDAPDGACQIDNECDDGLFCNGEEVCSANSPLADGRGCVAGDAPCGNGLTCIESSQSCSAGCPDEDGDGARSAECGGTDCDDSNPNRFPGNLEVCDVANLDEDCDPRTFGFRDLDGDLTPDAVCCNDENGTLNCGTDCNDQLPGVNPMVPEVCDLIDNDCDGSIDEGVTALLYRDMDMDGAGDEEESIEGCAFQSGMNLDGMNPYVVEPELSFDCDDNDPGRFPENFEICTLDDPKDDDCDDMLNEPDACGCRLDNGDIADVNETRSCGTQGICMGAIQTCTTTTGSPEWNQCSQRPQTETCIPGNRIGVGSDEDCDGVIDNGISGITCYPDVDGDGIPPNVPGQAFCPTMTGCPVGFTARAPELADTNYDCDDNNPNTFRTVCFTDMDEDGFGVGAPMYSCVASCPAMQTANDPMGSPDCCDDDPDAKPQATTEFFSVANNCGSFDYDCNGVETKLYPMVGHRACSAACGPDEVYWSISAPGCGEAAGGPCGGSGEPSCVGFNRAQTCRMSGLQCPTSLDRRYVQECR